MLTGGHAFAEGSDAIRPVKPNTIAKSLAIGNPADGWYALQAIRCSGDREWSADEEIIDGIRLLARTEGSSPDRRGVTIATLAKLAAQGVVRRDERVVAYVTGHELKTVEALVCSVVPTPPSPPPWRRSPGRGHRRRRRRRMPMIVRSASRTLRTLTAGAGGGRGGSTVGEVLKALDAAIRVSPTGSSTKTGACGAS